MNIKLSSFILLFTLISISINSATIRGKITDKNKQPLAYVNIALQSENKNNKMLGTNSNEDGTFEIMNITPGEYTATISFIGYSTASYNVSIKSNSDNIKLPTWVMKEDSELLSQVEIVGQASQMRFEIDKKVFDVDQSLVTQGASASEMLQNIPSVEVDNEGNVSLRNSQNVEIWINGKPSGLNEDNRAQILEQMPAGTIQSVELITNPSAKNDPEGSAGIINLVLKKERKAGYYGSVNAGLNYNIGSPLPGGNVGANFNYNSSKIDAYANVGFRYMNFKSNDFTDRYSFTPGSERKDTTSFLHNDNIGSREHWGVFGRGGLDFHISENHNLGLNLMLNIGSSSASSSSNYNTLNYKNGTELEYAKDNFNYGSRKSYNIGLDYAWTMIDEKGSEWRTSLDYGGHMREVNYFYEQRAINGIVPEYKQEQSLNGTNTSSKLKSDFTYKFSKDMKLEFGFNGSWQKRQSPSRLWEVLGDLNKLQQYNDFNYEEWIAALYAMYGARFGNFSMSLGLRGEYTNTLVQTREDETATFKKTPNDYFELYPTAFFSYSLPNNNELQINYTRRVNRPRGRQLNAFRDVSDSTNISFGNPYLTPEFANSFELNYIKTWEMHALSASLYFKQNTDVVQRVNFLDENNVMNTTYENISENQSAGLELVAKNKIAKWLNLTTTVNGYYSHMNNIYYDTNLDGLADLLSPEQSNFSWTARLMANFIMPYGLSGQVTGSYNSPRIIAQGRSLGQYSVDLGLRKSFLERKLNLSLTVRDLFNSRNWRNTTWGDNFWQYSEHASHGTFISLTASYNFGNVDRKKKPNEQMGSGAGDMEGIEDFEM